MHIIWSFPENCQGNGFPFYGTPCRLASFAKCRECLSCNFFNSINYPSSCLRHLLPPPSLQDPIHLIPDLEEVIKPILGLPLAPDSVAHS